MTITITATSIGLNAGPFIITDNLGNTYSPQVTRDQILNGYTLDVNDLATTIYLTSTGVCTNTTEAVIEGVPVSPSTTPSITPSITPSPDGSPSITPSITPSPDGSPSTTPSITPSVTTSPSITPSVTPSISISPAAASITPSITPTRTVSPSRTPSITPSTTLPECIEYTLYNYLTTTEPIQYKDCSGNDIFTNISPFSELVFCAFNNTVSVGANFITNSAPCPPSPSITPTRTPSTSSPACISISLRYNVSSSATACSAGTATYYANDSQLMNATKLWSNSGCTTPAANGYYSNGVNWRTWVSPSFVGTGNC